MYPNSVLSVWQLTIMAVVPVALLFGWLIAIFVASREPGRQNLAAAGSPEEPAVARISEHDPERPSADRMAA
jgi:hypothetical protein